MANFSSWKLIFANFSSGNFATIVFLLLHVFSAIYFLHGVHILNLGIEGASVHCTDMLFPFQASLLLRISGRAMGKGTF